MARFIKFTALALAALITLMPIAGYAEEKTLENYEGFRVKGRYLYDGTGSKVTLVGVNAMLIYWDAEGTKSFPNISRTGANAVRIFWNADKAVPVSKLDTAIENAIKNKLIPIPGLWNATGDWSKLDECVDWWLQEEVLEIIRKHEKYLIINIANEAGNEVPKDEWVKRYKEIITRFREAGVRVPLMIDAARWGRDESYILEKGQELVAHDPLKSIIFDWHPWDPNQPRSRYTAAIKGAADKDLCMVVGEFSLLDVFYDKFIDYKAIVEECEKYDTGWFPWSWRGADANDKHNITNDYSYDNLTTWGSYIVPYIREQSVRAAVFPKDMPPSAPSGLTVVDKSDRGISLQWNASNDDVQVASYEVYRDGKKVAATTSVSYIDTDVKPATEYNYSVKAVDSVGNLSDPSESVKAVTDAARENPANKDGKDAAGKNQFWDPVLMVIAGVISLILGGILSIKRKKK